MAFLSNILKLGKRNSDPGFNARDDEGFNDLDDQSQFELTHVGSYEIVAPIGSGGMGIVYKAIDRAKDKTIAVKVLDRRYDLDKKGRNRDYLGREVMIAASLNHPFIVQMHNEVIEQPDVNNNIRRCLLMEYIDGFDLKRHIADDDMPIRRRMQVCLQLCEGIDFLHQSGVVHRDIKPANFMIPRNGQGVKILDFGLSESNATWKLRWMKKGGGTRLYMSPEQLRKKRLDFRSDIFSFGITMYEFFAGRHPCNGTDTREIQKQIVDKRFKFDPPSKHNPDVPSHVDKVLLKALRRNVDNRYQSMTEMLLDLSRKTSSRI